MFSVDVHVVPKTFEYGVQHSLHLSLEIKAFGILKRCIVKCKKTALNEQK